MIPPGLLPPYQRRRKSSLRLLFSTDYSQHLTTRLLKTGYRLVIAVDVFTVLMWVWVAYGLSAWMGWFIPTMIYIAAPFLGLVWLAVVRITFEYLLVVFGISEKVHDLDTKVGYLTKATYDDRTPMKSPESAP